MEKKEINLPRSHALLEGRVERVEGCLVFHHRATPCFPALREKWWGFRIANAHCLFLSLLPSVCPPWCCRVADSLISCRLPKTKVVLLAFAYVQLTIYTKSTVSQREDFTVVALQTTISRKKKNRLTGRKIIRIFPVFSYRMHFLLGLILLNFKGSCWLRWRSLSVFRSWSWMTGNWSKKRTGSLVQHRT